MCDPLTLIVSAYRIPEDRIRLFHQLNHQVFELADVRVVYVLDRPLVFDDPWVTVLVYPEPMQIFNQAKVYNYGVRSVVDRGGIICKVDVDIVFSLEVLEAIRRTVCQKKGLVFLTAGINKFSDIRRKPWTACRLRICGIGGCMAFHAETWKVLHGGNENLQGWGGEDYDLHHRAKKIIPVETSADFPLYHLNHKERRQIDKQDWFPDCNDRNVETIFREKYSNPNWGLVGNSK